MVKCFLLVKRKRALIFLLFILIAVALFQQLQRRLKALFKINEKTNKIYLTKGDNASLKVKVYDNTGKERQLFDDDTITLTVRKTADSQIAFTKTANKGVIDFLPNDTKSLAIGTYCYDIQLTTFGGKIYTIIPFATFEIGQEVTQ